MNKKKINLEFNNQKWRLELDGKTLIIMGMYSDFLKDLFDETDKDSVLVLNGFHLDSFKKIFQFCKHHYKKNDSAKIIQYDEWDVAYVASLKAPNSNIYLADFLETCKFYKYNDIVNLFF
jgi:hypothetical protein